MKDWATAFFCAILTSAVALVIVLVADRARKDFVRENVEGTRRTWDPVARDLERIEVPGGWVYRLHNQHDDSIAFVNSGPR